MFLNYGRDKEFIVKSYVDASFDTDLEVDHWTSVKIILSEN